MKPDNELIKTLVKKAQYYQDRVPVFQIRQRSIKDMEKDAKNLAQRFAEYHGMKEIRMVLVKKQGRTTIFFPEGITKLHLFHASGAITVDNVWSPFQNIISMKAEEVDRESLIKRANEAVRRLGLDRSNGKEKLCFERLWQFKASGMTRESEQGNVVMLRVVAAFRRYLLGLPVWGRASVFVKMANEGLVDSWGMDWRPVGEDQIDQVFPLNPDEGAKKVLEELQTTLPGGNFTMDDFEPEFFVLGYYSMPKRRPQTVMQPVWVAMFRSKGWTSLNHLIVVPAVSTPYEPICRIVQLPPYDDVKPSTDSRKQPDFVPRCK